MPNLLDIRRRIRTVKNTQQITKAMKMVSAAKLRRAQDQAVAARPYAQRLYHLMEDLAAHVDVATVAEGAEGLTGPGSLNPAALLVSRPARRIQLIAVSSDKGLAGSFNANVYKAVYSFIEEHPGIEVQLELVGRKVRDFFRSRPLPISGEHPGVFGKTVDFAAVRAIAQAVSQRYAHGEVDEVYLIGNEFKTVLTQKVEMHRILPLEVPERKSGEDESRSYLFDSPPAELLARLLPRYLETRIYRSLLESFAGEHAARMNAMDAATRNAGDLIDSLTLNMNRVRQAAITKEIIEIVSGASALSQ